jgi:hypothetical protein
MTIATYSQEEKTDWIEIEKKEDRNIYYKVRSESSAWFKMIFKNDEFVVEGKVARESLMLVKFDCKSALYGFLTTIFYDDDGGVLENNPVNENLVKMDYIAPDSNMEFFYKTFCNRDKK